MINSEQNMVGYKKTKLGWIPEDWGVHRFDKVFDFKKSYSFSRNDLTFEEGEGDTFYIHYGDIHSKFDTLILHLQEENHAEIPLLKQSSKPEKDLIYLEEGDLVIADASEDYEGVGECIEIGELNNSKKLIAGLHTIVARDKSGKTMDCYRAYILKNGPVAKELKKIATGISVFGISKGNLSKLRIPLPPLPEQEKIAEILSTWDEAIQKTEALIKKKEKLKKGLMQQLLHPKDNWETYQIKELFTFHRSISASRKDLVSESSSNDILNIHYGDVHTLFNDAIQLDVSESENLNAFVDGYKLPNTVDYARNGDVIIVDASEDYEGVAECFELTNIDEKTVTAGLHTFLLRPKAQKTVSGFRSLIFKAPVSRKEIKRLVTGSNVFGLSKTNLSKLEVSIPPKDEQKTIVNVLSFAEREINDLVKLKEHQEYQKKGLMQQLLTGKTRVTVN